MDAVTLNMVTMVSEQTSAMQTLTQTSTMDFSSFYQNSIADNYSTDSVTPTDDIQSETIQTTSYDDTTYSEISSRLDSNETEDVDVDVDLDDLEDLEDDVMKKVASELDLSEEELQEIMDSLDISFVDLLTSTGLQTLVNEVFDVSSEVELLTNSEVFDTFKDIKSELDGILAEANISTEQLETMLSEQVSETEVEEISVVTTSVLDDSTSGDMSTLEGITSEVNGETFDGTSQDSDKSSGDNQGESFDNIFADITTQKVETVTVNGTQQVVYTEVSAQDIYDQIVTNVKVISTSESSTMSFQLTPENLGKVAFSVTSENGMITGRFVAENNTVKEAIEMNLSNLKANLDEQGIKVDDIKVVVGNTSEFFEKNDQERSNDAFYQNQSKKNVHFGSFDEEIEEEIQGIEGATSMPTDYQIRSDYSVEYTA